MAFFYLPRICNHCLNPACVASCPSGAIYKRGEDGVVLINQDVCRAWRMCVTACPYKKTYYNWSAGKSEKCILCYPRIEAGRGAGVHALLRGPHPLSRCAAVRCGPDRGRRFGRRGRRGEPADGDDPRSVRSGGHRRGEGQRDRRFDDPFRAVLAHLSVREGVGPGAAPAPGVPHPSDAVLRAAAPAGHGLGVRGGHDGAGREAEHGGKALARQLAVRHEHRSPVRHDRRGPLPAPVHGEPVQCGEHRSGRRPAQEADGGAAAQTPGHGGRCGGRDGEAGARRHRSHPATGGRHLLSDVARQVRRSIRDSCRAP